MRNLNKTHALSALAEHINAKVVGNGELSISGLCTLETPLPNNITFIRTDSMGKAQRSIASLPRETAVIVPEAVAPSSPPPSGPPLLIVEESYQAFLNLIPLFFAEEAAAPGVHPTASVHPTATIGEGASIGAYASIGPRCSIGKNFTMHSHARLYEDVSVGDNVTLYGGVSLRHGTRLGDRITIHDNSVIGADGFGYTPDPKLGLRKVPQLGNVIVHSDVEIGANTCIDRGAFGPTIIGRGAKIDNLVQVGHNVTIGSFAILCGGAGIAGSTSIGDGVVIGGRVGVADHLTITSGIRVGGGSAVITNLLQPGDYMGYPAIKASEWQRSQVSVRKLARGGRKK
ncbi:MAG: UDP-3-O-(3-hydroxymyristoyl)glucosamine N-acyltransferase [Pseudomonadota bacterium]|jgi:UDP-3-O-[3-hydroxymyristoyl] glucosamine N-acyltransferase